MRRRDFITLVGGAAAMPVLTPLAVRAQQPGQRMRRVGMLMAGVNDVDGQSRLAAFRQVLQEASWTEGQNIEIQIRWGGNDTARISAAAKEIVGLKPEVIVTGTSRVLIELRKVTTTIPTVFIGVTDPVGHGFVSNLARPGGNLTGFSNIELSLVGKWLQTLKEIAPGVTRAEAVMHADNGTLPNYRPVFEAFSASLAIETVIVPVRTRAEIEAAIEAFARNAGGGLVLPGDVFTRDNRDLIVALADRHRLPAVYNERVFVDAGGLMSYGHNQLDPFRGAASYVDRILRGEKPGDLPVQQPTKYELVINLKTAKALGLAVPTGLLVRADEVIE